MAGDDVELAAVAALRLVAAPDPDHPIAMREPRFTVGRVAGRGESLAEANLRRVTITVRKRFERQLRGRAHGEFWWQFRLCRTQAALAVRIAPLHDKVVLRTKD